MPKISLADDIRKALKIDQQNQNVKLAQAPTIHKKDKGTFVVPVAFAVVQADLMYIQEDKRGYKYILDVVDISSRAIDAIPLRGREAEDVIEGFEQIWKNKHIPKDKVHSIVTDSGSEFKNKKFKEYLDELGILHRTTMTARKNQTAIVEYYNGVIAKHLGVKMTSSELEQKTQYDNWSEDLKKIVEVLNKKEYKKAPPKIADLFGEPIVNPNEPILKEGDVVHVRLQQPINHMVDYKKERLAGKFRSGDLRWEKDTTTIDRVLYLPKQPIRYMVKKYGNVSFIRKELLLADEKGKQNQEEKERVQEQNKQEQEANKPQNVHRMTTRSKGAIPNDKAMPHWVKESYHQSRT